MTRNVVSPEDAEHNRTAPLGRYTFHALIPDTYMGIAITIACVRLGDHAHLDIDSGRSSGPGPRPRTSRGYAGRVILRWNEWLKLRALLDTAEWIHIAEVENPTKAQLDYHEFGGPPPVEERCLASWNPTGIGLGVLCQLPTGHEGEHASQVVSWTESQPTTTPVDNEGTPAREGATPPATARPPGVGASHDAGGGPAADVQCVVDFLDTWSYCPLSRPSDGAGRAQALHDAAQQLLDALGRAA